MTFGLYVNNPSGVRSLTSSDSPLVMLPIDRSRGVTWRVARTSPRGSFRKNAWNLLAQVDYRFDASTYGVSPPQPFVRTDYGKLGEGADEWWLCSAGNVNTWVANVSAQYSSEVHSTLGRYYYHVKLAFNLSFNSEAQAIRAGQRTPSAHEFFENIRFFSTNKRAVNTGFGLEIRAANGITSYDSNTMVADVLAVNPHLNYVSRQWESYHWDSSIYTERWRAAISAPATKNGGVRWISLPFNMAVSMYGPPTAYPGYNYYFMGPTSLSGQPWVCYAGIRRVPTHFRPLLYWIETPRGAYSGR